jgi:glycosyltransferase involved in cell wall biosynthesis
LSYLLELADKLSEKITVIGEGDMPALSSKQANNLIFLGKRSHVETLRYISRAKYLLQLSIVSETFGLTVLEAMSVGTPVIGFPIGTRLEFVQTGVTGFLSEANQLIKTVQEACQIDKEEYARIARNAIQYSEQFSEQVIIKKQLELYKKVCQKVKNPDFH